MHPTRDRILQMTGLGCLLGMGALLLVSAHGWPGWLGGDPAGGHVVRLAVPGAWLALAVVLALVLPLVDRGPLGVRRILSLVLLAVLAAVALGGLLPRSRSGDLERQRSLLSRLDRVRGEVMRLEPMLEQTGLRIRGEWEQLRPEAGPARAERGFRMANDWAARWREEFDLGEPLRLLIVIWEDGQRIAWSRRAEPLPEPTAGGAADSTLGVWTTVDGGLVRRILPGPRGWFELQVAYDESSLDDRWPGMVLETVAADRLPLRLDSFGEEIPDALWIDEETGWAVRLARAGPDEAEATRRADERGLVVAASAWFLLLLTASRLVPGPFGWLLALWAGRLLLASIGYFRMLGPLWFGTEFPAHPASPDSLFDPAYFATPFLMGSFASAVDALMSSALLALTVGWWLRRTLAVEPAAAGAGERDGFSAGSALRTGLALGILAAAALAALRLLAIAIAQNSNPRLIGEGISVSLLTFWVLHTVLMLMGISLLAVLPGLVRGAAPLGRGRIGAGWLGSVTAGVAAVLAAVPIAGWSAPVAAAAGAAAAALYWTVPALRSPVRFVRRLAWPALMLLAVGWNYLSLGSVYARAELAWLERKGEQITESAEDWMLFLLQDALQGMVALEPDLESDLQPSRPDGDLWRDEVAYRLWETSALRDLGHPCLVELIDEEGGEESLFATGQMKNFEFKVAGRSAWFDQDGNEPGEDWAMVFQREERVHVDGRETVLAGEAVRHGGRGWIRVEVPVESDRLSTLWSDLQGPARDAEGAYNPRAEVDQPVLLLRGGRDGWLSADGGDLPGAEAERRIAALRRGELEWAVIPLGDASWLCRWEPLAEGPLTGAAEGFLLGVQKPGLRSRLLDLSRLVLLNLALFFVLVTLVRLGQAAADRVRGGDRVARRWRPGFQERFLAGYLLLGMVLLVVVGGSVDRVGRDRIRRESHDQTRDGLALAVQQLRSLLVEQARSLAASEYIGDLLLGQLAGQRPAGPFERQQGMVFDGEGRLLLDETLSDLTDEEAGLLLEAGRRSPFLMIHEGGVHYAATVIPIDLGGIWAVADADSLLGQVRHGADDSDGYFLFRQRLEAGLIDGLAELVGGEATVRYDGQPIFMSQPEGVFSGEKRLLLEPNRMGRLVEFTRAPEIFASRSRPFAYTGYQAVPAFGRDARGHLVSRVQPAILSLSFSDRAREFSAQRRSTALFLAGLANLILLTALVLAVVMSWSIFRPLRVLLGATRSLARGEFDAPLPEAGRDEVGQLAAAFGLMRGELQTARDRLAARERFLATVLARVTVGVAVLDEAGEVVTLNPAGEEILASFEPDGEGPERVRRLAGRFSDEAAGSERWSGELRSRDGRRTLRGAIAPLELPGERRDTMLVFEDVTEFLQTKMMAVNAELARQVAHEIKNPLTPIQLSVQLLDQAWRDGHEQLDRIVRDTVQRVLEQVALLRTIAAEFSLLGRPGELEIEELDLDEVVRRLVAAYADGHEGGNGDSAAPRVAIAPGPGVRALGHAESLQKILGNLMQNSLDAAPAGEAARIDIDWRIGGGRVTLRWRDHGAGIPDEVADRLFDPYFSTKSSGTGLGLAICRNLADRMGGSIELGPPAGEAGAVFELTLPIATSTGETA